MGGGVSLAIKWFEWAVGRSSLLTIFKPILNVDWIYGRTGKALGRPE